LITEFRARLPLLKGKTPLETLQDGSIPFILYDTRAVHPFWTDG